MGTDDAALPGTGNPVRNEGLRIYRLGLPTEGRVHSEAFQSQ
jgi:hypothetical protein